MRDPVRVRASASTGSTPPISRCPVSRHEADRLPRRTRSTSSAFSTMVPTWGWSVASTPRSAASVGQPVEVGQQGVPAGLVEHRAVVVPLLAGGGGEDEGGRAGLRRNRRGPRPPRRSGSCAGSCRTTGTKPPTASQARSSARVFAFSAGSSGRKPSGPNSVARETDLAHLGEHRPRVVLAAPARDLADAPGDRGSGDPESKVSHRPISSGVDAGFERSWLMRSRRG